MYIHNACVYRGADVNSDHYLVAAVVKLKFGRTLPQIMHEQPLDIAKLRSLEVKNQFILTVRNHFRVLANIQEDGQKVVCMK